MNFSWIEIFGLGRPRFGATSVNNDDDNLWIIGGTYDMETGKLYYLKFNDIIFLVKPDFLYVIRDQYKKYFTRQGEVQLFTNE